MVSINHHIQLRGETVTRSDISVLIIGSRWPAHQSTVENMIVWSRGVVGVPVAGGWSIWAAGRSMMGMGRWVSSEADNKAM